jgi:hyperosmotically inducible periplasmic protein
MRTLVRFVLVLVLVVGVAALLLGYWAGSSAGRGTTTQPSAVDDRPPETGTTGTSDRNRAREIGAEAGARIGEAGARAGEELNEAAITARIKAKMALDETVKARDINVTTNGSTVTLRGAVQSTAERERAGQLARETQGITTVVNELTVRR